MYPCIMYSITPAEYVPFYHVYSTSLIINTVELWTFGLSRAGGVCGYSGGKPRPEANHDRSKSVGKHQEVAS